MLCTNRNYLVATAAVGLLNLFVWIISTVVGQLILPFGIADNDFTSLLGTCFNIGGIAGSVLSCVAIAKASRTASSPVSTLKRAALISSTLTLAALCYFVFATRQADRTQLVIAASLLGLSSYPIMFIAFELLVGLTPGVGEAMSCGILNSTANFAGFLVIVSATPFLGHAKKVDSMAVYTALIIDLVIATILILLIKVPTV